MSAMALAAAPSRVSNRTTGWPALAAVWAMPAPMAPLPITATTLLVSSAWAICLLSLEVGGALADEGGHAFLVVVAVAQLTHHLPFQLQLLRQGVGGTGLERLFRKSEALGGRRRKMRGHCHRFSHQLIVVHALPDQAPLLRLFGAEFFAQHGQSGGAGLADQAGQVVRAARVGDQAQLAEGFDETGRAGRQHDVAGQ